MPDTVKYILTECIDLAHVRETFFSWNDTKELFQNIEIRNNVICKTDTYIRKDLKKFQPEQNFSN